MTAQIYDFAIIGAGMAGASLAAELAPHARVLVLEAEDTPGYHATGRSAAFWEECYGGPEIVPLTLASGPFLDAGGFLSNRGALYIAREGQGADVEAFIHRFSDTGATLERLARPALEARLPGVKAAWQHAVWEPVCADIDVAGLHQHYLKSLKRDGADLRVRSALSAAAFDGSLWQLDCGNGERVQARALVNAAGAWADGIAQLAGVSPLGITPFRRTVAQLRLDRPAPDDLPLVLDMAGRFYFKPESGRLWLSPHDETQSEACDAAPEELDVALAIARLEEVMDWKVEAVERKWAGLRSFTPDRKPVYGPDRDMPQFIWFAGQGGYGIQTAPAAARLVAQMLLGQPADAMTASIDANSFKPCRFD